MAPRERQVGSDLPFPGTKDKRITQTSTGFETSLDVINEWPGPGVVLCGESARGITAQMLVGRTQLCITRRDGHLVRCGKGGIKVYLGVEATAAGLSTITTALSIASRSVRVRGSSSRELQAAVTVIVPHGRILVTVSSAGAGTVKRSLRRVPIGAGVPSGETQGEVSGIVALRTEAKEIASISEEVAVTAKIDEIIATTFGQGILIGSEVSLSVDKAQKAGRGYDKAARARLPAHVNER